MYIIVCMYNIIYIYIIPRVLHVMVSLPKKLGDLATIDVISWGLNPVIDQVILVNWWYTRLALFFVFTKDSIKQPPFGDVYTCIYIYIYLFIYTHIIYIYVRLPFHLWVYYLWHSKLCSSPLQNLRSCSLRKSMAECGSNLLAQKMVVWYKKKSTLW